MNRKVVAIWVTFIIVLSIIVIIVEIAPNVKAQTTWYVDDVPGSGGPGDPPEDFTSIQDAINAAFDGDTVFVYNGTYYEKIFISNSINLTGEDRNSTIINASDAGNVVTIQADWVNISGFTITNGSIANGDGITIDSNYNSITDNNIVYNNNIGIGISSSSVGNVIIDNNISLNNEGGMRLSTRGHNISGNIFHSNGRFGIFLDKASGNNITNNYIFSNDYLGLYLWSTTENNIYTNSMIEDGICIRGNQLRHWNTHDIDTSNTANGKPVLYLKNQTGGVILPGAGQIILANCTSFEINSEKLTHTSVGIELGFSSDINVIGNNISNNGNGIIIYNTSDIIIIKNEISFNFVYGIYSSYSNNTFMADNNASSNNRYGIYLTFSNINIIINNTVFLNNERGIVITDSQKNVLDDNLVNFNNFYGIALRDSNENIISDNFILDNREGLYIYYSNSNYVVKNRILSNNLYGLYVHHSNNNKILVNNISMNIDYGVYLHYSDWNNLTGNTVSSNDNYGLYLQRGANNNSIFYNNIINNTNQAFDDQADNYWYNDYPNGGNYWSDYNGIDLNSTPSQDVPPPDGIGDTPYIIDSDSQDNYPLMKPWNYFINLKQGWNLIAIPLIQEELNLTKILSSIDDYYNAVQWYDITDQSDPWKHHKIGKPYGNDLFELNETMGFWIHIAQPGDTIFLYNGTQPTSNQTIQLHPGWNMVGYPSLTSYNRTNGLNNLTFKDHVDAIWSYDATMQKWEEMGESDYFIVGRGYYIHATSQCEWEVPL